jgi:chromosome segregation ATPase
MFEQPHDQPTMDTEQEQNPLEQSMPPSDSHNLPNTAPQANPNRPQPEAADAVQDDLRRVREILLGGTDTLRQPIREAEVERLRNILFGPKMEEYERRFTDLRREIDRVLNDLHQVRNAMDEFRETQQEHIEAVERDLKKSIEDIGREIERVRSQAPILQQLVPQVRQAQTMINRLSEEVNDLQSSLVREGQSLRTLRTTIEQYRDQYERSLDTLKREKRQAEDELKEEMRRVADRLADQKTDRKLLAAILMEFATRLETGYNAVGIVEDFGSPAED